MGRADIATLPRLTPGVRLCLHPRALVGSAYDSRASFGTPDALAGCRTMSEHDALPCGSDRASRDGHLITHTSARSVVTGSQRNGRTSAQLALDIFGGIRDVRLRSGFVKFIMPRGLRSAMASKSLHQFILGSGIFIIAIAVVVLLVSHDLFAFLAVPVVTAVLLLLEARRRVSTKS